MSSIGGGASTAPGGNEAQQGHKKTKIGAAKAQLLWLEHTVPRGAWSERNVACLLCSFFGGEGGQACNPSHVGVETGAGVQGQLGLQESLAQEFITVHCGEERSAITVVHFAAWRPGSRETDKEELGLRILQGPTPSDLLPLARSHFWVFQNLPNKHH